MPVYIPRLVLAGITTSMMAFSASAAP